MFQSVLGKSAPFLIAALALGLLFWVSALEKVPSGPAEDEQRVNQYGMHIKGFAIDTYDSHHRRHIARIKADEFKIGPRRFWLFNVSSFNEATLTNARMEVHFYNDEKDSEINPFSFGEQLIPLKRDREDLSGLGIITRGLIKGLVLEVYREHELSMVVKAREAYLDLKNKKMRLKHVTLENVSSREHVESRSVTWDNEEKVFQIPGDYILLQEGAMKRGRSIKIDLDFGVAPL